MLRAYPTPSRRPEVFRDVRRVQEDMNRLFGALRLMPRAEFPSINLWVGPDGAIVTAEVPGVSPEQLSVTVHQDTVSLRGKREPEAVDSETIVHRQERPYGNFARSIGLPFRVDAERVSARFSRGILTLELPRPEADKPRQVKIGST